VRLDRLAVKGPIRTACLATLRRALALAEGPVVLVGHSYGGAVITEVGRDDKVSALVFVAAFAPDAGESAASLGQTVEAPPMSSELRPDAEGFLKLTEIGVLEHFAQDLSETERTVLFAAQAPTAVASLAGTISEPAWRSRPSWYRLCGTRRTVSVKYSTLTFRQASAAIDSTSFISALSLSGIRLVPIAAPRCRRQSDRRGHVGGCERSISARRSTALRRTLAKPPDTQHRSCAADFQCWRVTRPPGQTGKGREGCCPERGLQLDASHPASGRLRTPRRTPTSSAATRPEEGRTRGEG